MIKVQTEEGKEYTWESAGGDRSAQLNGEDFEWDKIEIREGVFHILKNNKSYRAEIIESDSKSKEIRIKVNGNEYKFKVKNRFDLLLEEMGIEMVGANKADDLKAPMPGLVIDVMVEAGQQILKGDAMLVLEAMKMENILKAGSDGVVKSIQVKKGDKVEKNTVLISME